MSKQYNAVVTQEGKLFVALNPETNVASQGKTMQEALTNLRVALGLYLEETNIKSSTNPSYLTTITV